MNPYCYVNYLHSRNHGSRFAAEGRSLASTLNCCGGDDGEKEDAYDYNSTGSFESASPITTMVSLTTTLCPSNAIGQFPGQNFALPYYSKMEDMLVGPQACEYAERQPGTCLAQGNENVPSPTGCSSSPTTPLGLARFGREFFRPPEFRSDDRTSNNVVHCNDFFDITKQNQYIEQSSLSHHHYYHRHDNQFAPQNTPMNNHEPAVFPRHQEHCATIQGQKQEVMFQACDDGSLPYDMQHMAYLHGRQLGPNPHEHCDSPVSQHAIQTQYGVGVRHDEDKTDGEVDFVMTDVGHVDPYHVEKSGYQSSQKNINLNEDYVGARSSGSSVGAINHFYYQHHVDSNHTGFPADNYRQPIGHVNGSHNMPIYPWMRPSNGGKYLFIIY